MPDGLVKYLRVVGHPSTEDGSGNFELVGAVTDITERKQAERRLRAQYTVTQLLAEAATLEEVTPKILQTVCEFLLWDLGVLWTYREAGVLRCVEVWHKESVKAPQFEAISRESTFKPKVGLPAGSGPAMSPHTFGMSFMMLIFRARRSPRAKGCTQPLLFPFCSAETSWGSLSFSVTRYGSPNRSCST